MRRKRRAAGPVNFDWGRIAQQCPQFLQRFDSNAIRCIIFSTWVAKSCNALTGSLIQSRARESTISLSAVEGNIFLSFSNSDLGYHMVRYK